MSSCRGKNSVDGKALKLALASAIAQFSRHVDRINEMNVFPVPDGDTGINMYHTLQRAYREISHLDDSDVAEVSRRFAYGALMGARGNSGTILSQLLKGFAEQLQTAEALDTPQFALACKRAAQFAYEAVTSPVEGTILTVAREAAETLDLHANDVMALPDALDILVRAAQASLRRTPELLPILKESGVVDSGALGLVLFLEGLASGYGKFDSTEKAESPVAASPGALMDSSSDASYGYDVQFLMLGKGLNIAQIRQDLGQVGWSLLVVGDDSAVKVHIHVDNPALPIDYAVQSGATLDDIVVENMELQFQRRPRRETSFAATPKHRVREAYGVIAVAPGDGLRAVCEDLGCEAVIPGGQGRNPSVEDFLVSIDSVNAASLFILPNNRNIILTARQAAENAAERRVDVLPTTSVIQGISALIALRSFEDSGEDVSGGLDSALSEMRAAAQQVCSIEIARATRDSRLGGLAIRCGDFLATGDGQILVAGATIEASMLDALAKVLKAEHELVTLYYGDDIQEREAKKLIERLSFTYSELEFDLVYGGQDLYPFLIGLE
ncbi:MAG: DAK2 domain-containing protein [Chloroflexota bacterium]|nr:DAK2 domain-containing protein [Chloroflexota bacterium]